MGSYWVYILQVTNGHYYTGYTTDIHRRYKEHVEGKGGCRFTRSFPPTRLAQCWKVNKSKGSALRIEQFVKKRSRKTKCELVHNPELLMQLLRKYNMDDTGAEPCDAALIEEINAGEKGKPPGKGGKKPGGCR